MKNFILLVLIFIRFSFVALSQTDIPVNVKDGFAKKFPTAKKVKWEKENDTEFEASFKQDGKTMTANFDEQGNWLETEWEVKLKELPEEVKTAVAQKYPGFEIDEAEYQESPDFTGYEMVIEKQEGKQEIEKEIQVSKDGQTINELKEEAGEESED